jgi:hypothetical protein
MSSEEMRCSQARQAPSTHAEVGAGVTRCEFDMQRKTNGGGRLALMASQQVAGGKDNGVAEPRGPSGIEPACSRVRAEVFYRWPARLDSASVCACKATDHAQAG